MAQAALDEAGKVVKKQKTCAERVDASIDQLISLVQAARARLASQPEPGAVRELQQQIQKLGLEKEMNSQTKELHTAVGKLNKARAHRRAASPCSPPAWAAPPSATSPGRRGPARVWAPRRACSTTRRAAGRPRRAAPPQQALDKLFEGSVDVCKALRSVRFDPQTLNQARCLGRTPEPSTGGTPR
jgi:transcriptional regulator with GAF, ATPase, and Fis domain